MGMALIAAASGLVGTLIGGSVTYIVNAQNIDANREQAKATFLREQQQAAYGKFVADMAVLSQCYGEIATAADDEPVVVLSAILKKCKGLGRAIGQEDGPLELISADAVTNAITNVYSRANDLEKVSQNYVDIVRADPARAVAAHPEIGRSIARLLGARWNALNLMRADVQ